MTAVDREVQWHKQQVRMCAIRCSVESVRPESRPNWDAQAFIERAASFEDYIMRSNFDRETREEGEVDDEEDHRGSAGRKRGAAGGA